MALGLARDLMRRMQGRAETNNDVYEWASAATVLSNVLLNSGGDSVEAEALCRETMSAIDGLGIEVDGAITAELSVLSMRLGRALTHQGKGVDAHVIFVRGLAEATKTFGPDHQMTIEYAVALGDNLCALGKHTESVKLLRDIVETTKRAYGSDSAFAVQCCNSLEPHSSSSATLLTRAQTFANSP